jgi:predicted RNA binding protein with dsRBD fold (UPF0201 family)
MLGTQYENRATEIIDFILPRKKDGTAIYQVLKEALGKK